MARFFLPWRFGLSAWTVALVTLSALQRVRPRLRRWHNISSKMDMYLTHISHIFSLQSFAGYGRAGRLLPVAVLPQSECAAVWAGQAMGIRTGAGLPDTSLHPPTYPTDVRNFIVGTGMFQAPSCAEDTTCFLDIEMYGNSVVQLADPVNGGYCTGEG